MNTRLETLRRQVRRASIIEHRCKRRVMMFHAFGYEFVADDYITRKYRL